MSKFNKFGRDLIYIANGFAPGEGHEKEGFVKGASQAPSEVRLLVCKMAANMFAGCDREDSFEFHLLDRIGKQASWNSSFDPCYDSVIDALGLVIPEIQDEAFDAQHVKEAGLLDILRKFFAGGVVLAPKLLTSLGAIGLAGGAAVGTLAWHAGRGAKEDSAATEQLKARTKHYDSITDEISQQLANRDIRSAPDMEKLVRDSVSHA